VALKNFYLLLMQLLVPPDLYETYVHACTMQWNERIDNDYYIDNHVVEIVRSVRLANTISIKAGRHLGSGS